ncbi:pseudo-response regulator 7 [Actinidia rufa]|uniref:Pseudo-response regulator 7 n=1 Tax=Actinidia rufa TaxID=165716 RepID=A0A7J0EDT7_9ERIC|nr:pseudo-response regulator 7 [Actinidia rufa]
MRGIWVNTKSSATKGLAELNHHLQDEQKYARDRGAGEGQRLTEKDESRINEGGEVANCGQKELAVQQNQQQQPQGPQGPVVHWERFLPIQSLKVLLVEDDDSTRHVVSALLRNCSYEVTAVANSLKAWKILEDLTNHIDLVLIEVVMPYLSGIGLLRKIMSHKTFKNIPVIMMSSNDSMGIVLKCLSEGAVDFLVKPIRKNELKNLWQHVWRKCNSSSGSGSESGVQTKKSTKSKSVEGSDYNMGSNNDDDNASTGLNVRDGSDNGSGTQSSWTKRAVEFNSPESMSPRDQLAGPPDSTCAQVLHSRPKAFSNNWPPTMATREYHGQGNEHGNVAMGKDLEEIGVPRNPDLQLENQGRKVSATIEGTRKEMLNDLESKKGGEKLKKEKLELNCEARNRELRKEAADLIGTMTNFANSRMESVGIDVPNDISNTNIKGKAIYNTKDIPSLELSLKTLRNVGEIGTGAHAQERNVLRHSDLSAFSRYNTISAANQAPMGNVDSCLVFDNISEAPRTESMHNLKSNFNGNLNQHSNGSNDMGSTTNNAFTKPEASGDRPMSKSAIKLQSGSALQPVQNGNLSSHQSGKADANTANTVLAQSRDKHQEVQIQHHHHHYHHYHHHVRDKQQQPKQLPNHNDPSLRKHCGPSNSSSMPIEGNAANYSSLNGSISGSNNGSNVENGSSTAVIPEGANIPNDNGLAGKCGAAGGGGSGSGVDQNRYAQREAALNKFRLKRKDRCAIKAGKDWQNRDHVFEDNLCDRPSAKTKTTMKITNQSFQP